MGACLSVVDVLLQSSYYSKLEKADILEMTVKYLTSLQRQRVAVAGSQQRII